MLPQFRIAKDASRSLALITDEKRNEILLAVADAIMDNEKEILEANAKDLSRMDKENPLYDRLQLTPKRLADIAGDMRNVAALPSPLGKVISEKTLPNGLELKKVSVPFGVIGMVFEARPNVAFDVFSLCFKSGNACVLKGGRDADDSNKAIVALIKSVIAQAGCDDGCVELLPATHEATAEMLSAVGYIDVCIPRGGRKLIDFVRDNAKVPVIETGAGVVHAYLDKDADFNMAARIIINAKTRRVSVCNALDCLIVHKDRLADLPTLGMLLMPYNVKIYADPGAYGFLNKSYPDNLLAQATDTSFGTEFMDYAMAIKTIP